MISNRSSHKLEGYLNKSLVKRTLQRSLGVRIKAEFESPSHKMVHEKFPKYVAKDRIYFGEEDEN